MNNQGLNGIQADLDQLDLNDEETGISFGSDGSLVLQEVQDESFTLVGRLLTDKPYKFKVFKQVMASVWRPALGMQINQGEDGLIWFRFFHRKDAERILSEGPDELRAGRKKVAEIGARWLRDDKESWGGPSGADFLERHYHTKW
ncbi:hypothetical protein DM860_003115 [Cuscuta australis]|uniref:DUF4283 domain-containing protein n=1 Tax=Cuscuta australis TaxID=267555 RepID=A0A328D1D6_9ASTE|nr:hypothetical protein DM860_003115 [Cuscuta australis]